MACLEIRAFFLLHDGLILALVHQTQPVLPRHSDHQRHSHMFSAVPQVGAVLSHMETRNWKSLYLQKGTKPKWWWCASCIYGLRGMCASYSSHYLEQTKVASNGWRSKGIIVLRIQWSFSHPGKQTKLEFTMLSELSQTEKDKCGLLFLKYNIQNF